MTGVGVALALVAAVADACAVVLTASEDRRTLDRDAMRVTLLKQLMRRRRWLAGTGLMVLVGVAQIVALGFAPIAVVQPLLATSQLVLLAIARFKLRERVGRAEVLAALAIVVGLGGVVYAAPSQSNLAAGAAQLAPPLAVVGGLAAVAYVAGRARPAMRLLLVVGAGLAYACTDFFAKLLSDAGASGAGGLAGVWLVALLLVGGAAFLEETTALQHRPAVTVAPVITAVKVPLPVLMALWAGIEPLRSGAASAAVLLAGLALSAAGAAALGRSNVVARLSDPAESPGLSSSGPRRA